VNEHEQGTEKDWLPKLQFRYARRSREGKSRIAIDARYAPSFLLPSPGSLNPERPAPGTHSARISPMRSIHQFNPFRANAQMLIVAM